MPQKNCLWCGISYRVKPYEMSTSKYCSKPCHARGTVAGKNKARIAKKCIWCGKDFDVPKHRSSTALFCCRLCHNKSNGAALKGTIRATGIQTYRRHRGPCCERCGSTFKLLVHHKDEDRYNNAIDNLETLCKRCHQIHHECWKNLPQFSTSSFPPQIAASSPPAPA